MGEKTRETILLDPNKVWNTKKNRLHETIENCKEFSVDVMKLKGTRRDEVLLRFYAETASLKADAVWYVYKVVYAGNSRHKILNYK